MPLTDITPYRKYVDHFDLSEEQKVELIHIIWNIMENFADIAFGKHSVQQCQKENTRGLQEPKRDVLLVAEQKCSGV